MSKNSRTKAKERRDREKAGRKAAMKAQYQAWSEKGENTKSFRHKRKADVAAKQAVRHRRPERSNAGCNVSHPLTNLPLHIVCLLAEDAGYRDQFTGSSRVRAEARRLIARMKLTWSPTTTPARVREIMVRDRILQ